MTTTRRVDAKEARALLETVLSEHTQEFENFFLVRFLGFEFEYLPKDKEDADKQVCRIRFPLNEMVMNPQGTLQGGIMAVAMDVSMGHLVRKVAKPGATIEMKVQFMRPGLKGPFVCEGRFLKRGRSISFMESRIEDADGAHIAQATATWKMP